jgi:hypothetical protein
MYRGGDAGKGWEIRILLQNAPPTLRYRGFLIKQCEHIELCYRACGMCADLDLVPTERLDRLMSRNLEDVRHREPDEVQEVANVSV